MKYENLINRLADKTLSFGCMIKKPHSRRKYSEMINASNNGILRISSGGGSADNWERITYENAFGDITTLKGKYENLGHPILIGDVLEKMMEKGEVTSKRIIKLYDLWIRDIGNKSLQTILVDEVKSVSVGGLKPKSGGGLRAGCEKQLSPQATELFDFLIKIL